MTHDDHLMDSFKTLFRWKVVVPHKFACVVDLYVEPEYRKCGVGKALLESVKEWTKSRGLEYLELSVLEENLIGRNFYEREISKPALNTLRYVL